MFLEKELVLVFQYLGTSAFSHITAAEEREDTNIGNKVCGPRESFPKSVSASSTFVCVKDEKHSFSRSQILKNSRPVVL